MEARITLKERRGVYPIHSITQSHLALSWPPRDQVTEGMCRICYKQYVQRKIAFGWKRDREGRNLGTEVPLEDPVKQVLIVLHPALRVWVDGGRVKYG